jgi:hypothetical protein
MRVSIISSCTKRKAIYTPKQLVLSDFRDVDGRKEREGELLQFALPAAEMYAGLQHLEILRGLKSIRKAVPEIRWNLKIVSAGYGLVDENDIIYPYDVTFKKMGTKRLKVWSESISIPAKIRASLSSEDMVIFLLGSDYLRSIAPPLHPLPGQRFIFVAKPALRSLVSSQAIFVSAGKEMANELRYRRFRGLKGYLLRCFFMGLQKSGANAATMVARDTSGEAFLSMVRIGRSLLTDIPE